MKGYRRRLLSSSLAVVASLALQSAAALEFGFESAARFGGPASDTVMTLRGEILEGDQIALRRFIAAQRERWLDYGGTVVPVIDGGDVEEAKQIGAFLRDALSEIRVPDTGSSRCISACFFVLAQAVERHALSGTVGMHRPFFDREAMAGATPAAARSRYAQLLAGLRAELIEWSVPQALIEHMFATPSTDVYWLSGEELARLGAYAPWFAEYAAARCGLDARAHAHIAEMRAVGDLSGIEALEQSGRNAGDCIARLRAQARQDLLETIAGE